MASEIHGDLAAIHDEDLLRRMWQQTEDFGLKKEIRTHMYKLREARLRDFYTTGDMDSSGFGPTKTPLTPSHGDSLADQSFQSFKTKEIRDSESPTHELKFTRSGVIVPDTSGWNVVTSSEVSPDGKAYKTESIATTEGIQHIPGGRAEFAGKNEHLTKVSHQGDDRNYVKTAGESSATHLEEKSVTGDERSGRVEKKSTTTTSSSHVSSSKFSSTEGDPIPFDHQNIENEFEQLVDSTRSTNKTRSGTVRDHQQQQKQHQQIQNERYRIDGSTNQDQLSTNRNDENLITKHDSRNIQQEVDFLAAQPGKLISRTVDYPDPNTKVITETKSLPDGTTVTTRRYETKSASSKSFRSSSNQQQSTTSRTVVEDRAQRNRVEYIKDNVIDQVQQPTNQVNRTIRNDHTNETVQRTNRTENVTNKQFLDRKDSTQSIDTVDRSTTRRENLKDQVENVMLDSMHRTVKKDLSQKYRNQEFIDTERDYQSRPSNMPEYQQPIRPSQNTSAVRTEHIETFREIDTDHKSSVVKEPQQPQPAAGKPSYNTQQPSSRPSPSKDQQRSPPSSGRPSPAKDQHPQYAAGKPSYSPQPSTPIHRTSDQHPTQPGYERQIPIDTSGYPRGKSPDDQCPEFDRPTQQPDYVPRTDDRQPTTRAAGKPSYTPQQPVGKPPNTQPDTGTDRPYQQPGHVRDIPIDREPIYSDRPQHRPVREQDLPTEKPYQSDTTTTTRETRIHRTDRPDDHQPGYYNSRPSGPQPQQSGVREIPVDRSDDYEPRHPAGKPSVTPQKPSDSQPQSYQSPRQEQPEYVNTTPIERQPDRTAGKPSYNRQPERPSTTTEVREEYNEYSDIRRKDITQGYPSDRPQQPGRSYPRESPTRHGYEPSRPVERSSPGDRTYPRESPTRPLSDRPQYSRRPSEESRVSTDSSRYANKKISVEVNPTHDAFARSLRCVSPSDRGSVRSLRTSTTSIRSSKSPEKRKPHDKRTHRSPSRDSITYSESSRISSSTVTKGRTDTTKDIRRTQPKTPTAVSPKSQPSKVRPETHRSNETIDLTTRKGTKHHITTITKEIDEYPGENGSPSKPSSVKPTTRTASIQNDRKPKKTTTTTTVTSVTQKSPIKEPVDRMIPQKSRPETIDKTDQTITIELIDEIKPKFKKPTPGSTTTSTVIDDKRSTQKTTTTKKSPEPTKTFPENKKTHPSTPEVSRSPYSSPERSTRPEQPNREPLYDTPKSLKKVDTLPSPYPTPEKPVDTATTKPKFTKTVRVDNAIIRGDKPTSRGPKKPNGRHPTSDDEGFEPESPRSSSPTSSVSDLVYQKNPEDHQPEVTTVTSTSTRRDTINREFIDRERENIEKNKTKKTTMTVDDSTFERRKQRKESPQHIDRPRQDSPEPFDVEYPRRESPERFSPRRDTEDNREYSPERSGPRRHPSELTRPRLDSPIRGSPERFTPRQESPERHYSRENSPEPDSLNPKEPREPFYLIEPRKPGDIDEPKKPEDIKKPKTHPQLTRSETYEERCRQILGMDPKETTDEMVRKSISPQRDTIDFITTERITEERTYKPMPTEPTPSPRSTSPRKLLPDDDAEIMRRSKAPTRETSPTKRSESPRETTVCYVETEISTRRLPYDQSPEDSPRRRSPESSPSRKPKTRDVPRRGSPESSPSRKPTTRDAPRRASPESSPSRKPTTRDAPRRASPESSPSKKPTTRDAPRRASPESSPSRKPSTRDAPRRVSPESSPSRKPSTRDVPRRESPESSPSRKPTTRDAPCRTSPESSPSRKPITRDSPRMTSPASSPSRKPAVKDSPRRGSPDSSPSRKPTTRDSSVKRSPETSPSRKPSTRTPSVKESPATSPIRKTSIRECPRQLSPATSPSRKPSSRNAPRQQSPSPVRKSSKKTVPRAISPQTSPDRKTLARDSPQTSSPVRNTSARDSPQTTPVRKPSARDSPQNSSFKKPSDKDTPFMRSPDTSPLRKPSSRAEPHRRSPDSSPVRKSYPRHEPRKHSPDTSSIQRESPHRQSPGTSPARKPSTRDAPRRRSPEPTPSRKPYGDTRDLKEKTYRKSPSSSPTRKHPAESPEGRSPHTSPTRSSPTCRKPVQPSSISPSHHEPSMTTETVTTVVTKKLVRDSPISKSPRHTEQSPERPNHVTTAKIHLSPTLGRKSSSPDMKKSTKSPQTKPTSDVRTSSVVTSTREDTPRTSKSTVPQSTLKQPIEKFTTDKRTTTEIRRGEDKTYVQRKHREEKVTDVEEDEDSDVVSDSEDIETVIETTTVRTTTGKKHPGKKQPVTERKESAPVFRTTAKVDKDKMTRSTSDNLIRTTTRRSKPEIDAPTGPKESPRKKSIDKKRPVKCMTTKTINLTTTNNIINSEDMENVIIDIQQAKSSREPSPNRLVPTPVHHDEYTGSPRYPDTVDEPEDEVRRKPKVNDIPIFEEDTQDYVRCHISEVEDLKETIERKTSRLHRQSDEETTTSVTTIKKNSRETSPIKDRPRYSQSPERDDDEYRLSVHDKVSKFITTAEEVQKPKPSAPFQRDTRPENFTEPDDCLLSVNAKVNKFLTTAESVTKPIQATDSPSKRPQRPSVDEIDEELRTDECILSVSEKVNKFITTAEKLAATTPQKSPQLVAKIERQVSRKGQSSDENDKEYEKEPEAPKRTPKTSVTDRYNPTRPKQGEKPAVSKPVVLKSTEAVKKAKSVFENGGATKPKQRDILSRPSVWEGQREPDVKLQDIGVYKPFDDETEEIINRERSRSRSPGEDEEIPENCPKTIKISTTLSDSVSSKKNLFENRISTSTVKTKTTKQNSQDIISRTPTRRPIGNISSPSSAPTNRQPVEKTKPSEREPTVGKRPQERDQPQEYSPTKRPQKPLSTRNPKDNEPDDVEYIEDYSSETTTTTRRTERRSPSRHCEYSPTGRPENYSPTRYAGGMPDDYSSERDVPRRTGDSPTIRASRRPDESTTQPKARRPDDSPSRKAPERPKDFSIRGTPRTPDGKVAPTTRSTTQVERTQTTKSSTTRRPDDYSPARTPSSTRTAPQTPSKSTPRRLFDGKDNSPARHELAPQISNESRPSYMEPTVSSLEHRRESLEPITHSRHDLAPQTSSESRPSYMEPTVSSLEHRRESLEPITHSRQELASPLPIGSRPSYMEPTVSSIEHRRDSLDISKTHSRRTSHDSLHSIEPRDGNPRSGIKFGVELKRMDSRENKVRRKSSSSDIPHVEEIYDLELLEKMLETVVGYEHRRRIRSQIRIVKKMIEDQIHHKTITTRTVTTKKFGESPSGKPETYVSRPTEMSPDRRPSSTRKTTNDSRSHSNQFIETESRHITRHEGKHVTRERSISPRGKVRTVTTTTTEVRKAGEKPITKKSGPQQPEDKPIWATKNILKKPSDNDRTVVKRTTTTKTQKQRMITKDDEDCITSSYGIGPTDEDGKPLFGIRALKKKSQQPGETTKVTGSVVTESYYSENGAPPVGERKVTVYSTNPDDVDDYETLIDKKQRSDILTRERSSKDGMTSVTRIQKIGNRKDAEVVELPAITDVKPATTSTKQSKIVRKGSVKEMSEKFTRKESSSSITEKTGSSSYPKAGLILRTQTHTSSEYDDPTDECDIEIRTTRKQSRTQTVTESDSETESRRVSKTTKSFLNSGGSKVTGVDDVLDRMRNADNVVEDGDTIEDQEARSLLNKFLGASVLMSGMESMMPKEVVTRTIVESPGKHELKTTRVTKTIKTEGSSSPVARKTCDIEEIWDVEYLKELLEKSTNYEERRRIRARIRQLMAEKEDLSTTETTETKEKDGAVVTTTTKVITRTIAAAPKPVSPFAKFRQLDKQNSQKTFK